MRKSCLACVCKHISKAIILLSEAKLGYPIHKWLALGNLSEAEDECIAKYPDFAKKIREIRINIECDMEIGIKLLELLEAANKLLGIENNEK